MQPVILLIYQYDYREVLSASPVIHLLLSHEAVKPNQSAQFLEVALNEVGVASVHTQSSSSRKETVLGELGS